MEVPRAGAVVPVSEKISVGNSFDYEAPAHSLTVLRLPGGTQTTAVLKGDRYVLTGEKMWISLADVAEYYYVNDLRQTALNNCTSGSSGNNVCANDTMTPLGRDSATHQHMTTYTIGLGVNGTLPYQANYLEAQTGTYVQLTNGALNWPVPVASTNGGDARQIDDLWHAAVNGRGKYFATSNATSLANAVAGALTDAVKVLEFFNPVAQRFEALAQ